LLGAHSQEGKVLETWRTDAENDEHERREFIASRVIACYFPSRFIFEFVVWVLGLM